MAGALLLALLSLPARAQGIDGERPSRETQRATRTDAPRVEEQPVARPGGEVPYLGGEVPHGARLITRPRTTAFYVGAVTFAVSWVPFLAMGLVMAGIAVPMRDAGTALFGLGLVVPVAGPIIFGLGSSWLPLFIIPALLQGLGLGLAAWAHFNPEQVLRFDPAPVQWTLLPGAGSTPTGATLALRF